jgi:EpsI family protein
MTRLRSKALVAVLVLVLLGGFGTYLKSHQIRPERGPDFGKIPFETAAYLGTEHRFEDYEYEVLKADTSTLRMYREESGDVFWLFIAYFSSQKYGSQIHSPKHCLPGGGYRIVSNEPYTIDLGSGGSITVNRLLIVSQRRQELMLYWFETRTGVIANEFGLKLDLMKNAVRLLPTDAAICRLTLPLSSQTDFDDATAKATVFIRAFYPAVESALPFGRSAAQTTE